MSSWPLVLWDPRKCEKSFFFPFPFWWFGLHFTVLLVIMTMLDSGLDISCLRCVEIMRNGFRIGNLLFEGIHFYRYPLMAPYDYLFEFSNLSSWSAPNMQEIGKCISVVLFSGILSILKSYINFVSRTMKHVVKILSLLVAVSAF